MHYFQVHTIAVYTEFPQKNILSKVDLSSQLSRWAIEFGQSNTKFLPRAAIKGQVLADFIVEFLPRAMSPEKGNIASAHRREESSGEKLVETQLDETQSAQDNNEPIKEPSIVLKNSRH